jgi:hypothetical protein
MNKIKRRLARETEAEQEPTDEHTEDPASAR